MQITLVLMHRQVVLDAGRVENLELSCSSFFLVFFPDFMISRMSRDYENVHVMSMHVVSNISNLGYIHEVGCSK